MEIFHLLLKNFNKAFPIFPRYTKKKDAENGATNVYAFVFKYPDQGSLILGSPIATSSTKITMLGYAEPFKYTSNKQHGITIHVPPIHWTKLPTTWAWVFKMTNLQN